VEAINSAIAAFSDEDILMDMAELALDRILGRERGQEEEHAEHTEEEYQPPEEEEEEEEEAVTAEELPPAPAEETAPALASAEDPVPPATESNERGSPQPEPVDWLAPAPAQTAVSIPPAEQPALAEEPIPTEPVLEPESQSPTPEPVDWLAPTGKSTALQPGPIEALATSDVPASEESTPAEAPALEESTPAEVPASVESKPAQAPVPEEPASAPKEGALEPKEPAPLEISEPPPAAVEVRAPEDPGSEQDLDDGLPPIPYDLKHLRGDSVLEEDDASAPVAAGAPPQEPWEGSASETEKKTIPQVEEDMAPNIAIASEVAGDNEGMKNETIASEIPPTPVPISAVN
ncbi:hypothetical protein CYMTET_36187, partial [Cymbomonas tetramitiformis]